MDNCVDIHPLEYADFDPIESTLFLAPPLISIPMASTKANSPNVVPADSLVQSLVSSNKVVVFSKSQCPHCKDSKLLLKENGVEYMTVELDTISDGKSVQDTLGQMTDARTVPRIFINGQCVGGNSDLQTLKQSGQLHSLLRSSDSESENTPLEDEEQSLSHTYDDEDYS